MKQLIKKLFKPKPLIIIIDLNKIKKLFKPKPFTANITIDFHKIHQASKFLAVNLMDTEKLLMEIRKRNITLNS